MVYLWRAVDAEGEVLEAVVTARRDKAAALKLLRRIMKKYGPPRKIVTDGLCYYSAAMKEIGAADRQEVGPVGPRLNNRAENSHLPFRRRERAMQRFRSMKTLQKFSSVHAQVHNHFHQERHLVSRDARPHWRSGAPSRRRSPLARWRVALPIDKPPLLWQRPQNHSAGDLHPHPTGGRFRQSDAVPSKKGLAPNLNFGDYQDASRLRKAAIGVR
jgi:hypothetical protein